MTASTVKAKTRMIVLFAVLIPVFIAFNRWAPKLREAPLSDFANYWQAGRMILEGKNVYDSQDWKADRDRYGTAPYSELTFQYPLPFAIFMVPFSLLDVTFAFSIWMFLEEVALLTSIVILFTFYPGRSMCFELLVIATAFLFRPTLIVISSGQTLAIALFLITFSIYLFSVDKPFYGGVIASLTLLKPSFGAPFLVLLGLWLLSKKQWNGIAGVAAGALSLYGAGALYNPHWALDYLPVGYYHFDRYYGRQTTLWGVVGFAFTSRTLGVAVGGLSVCIVFLLTAYFLMKQRTRNDSFLTLAALATTTLLVELYSWSYEQILLIIPIIYILITIAQSRGDGKAALFSLAIFGFAVVMSLISYAQEHDAWNLPVTGAIWITMLFLSATSKGPSFHPQA